MSFWFRAFSLLPLLCVLRFPQNPRAHTLRKISLCDQMLPRKRSIPYQSIKIVCNHTDFTFKRYKTLQNGVGYIITIVDFFLEKIWCVAYWIWNLWHQFAMNLKFMLQTTIHTISWNYITCEYMVHTFEFLFFNVVDFILLKYLCL